MANTLKIVLVDDEPLALASLEKSLSQCGGIEVVATFQNGSEAAQKIPDLGPDIAFLDIQMPGLNGLQAAKRLMDVPHLNIVFVTAFSEHAIQAFKVHAIDYILKPYEDSQIARIIDRVRQHRKPTLPKMDQLMEMLQTMDTNPRYPTRLLVKEERRALIVQTDEILWIGGARNYVELHTNHKTYLFRQTMNQLEAALDPAKFIRIHRSKMVNLNDLISLEKPSKNQLEVITRDGTRHTVSNRFRGALEAALEF